MKTAASSMMSPLSHSPTFSTLICPSKLHPRYLHFLSFSPSIFPNYRTHSSTHTKPSSSPHLIVRNCTSITAKPSSAIRKNHNNSEQDDKLRALRELFAKPGIGIDAYIIPSQDAHQVVFWSLLI